MVSRRHALQLGAGALVGLAGCLDTSKPTARSSAPSTPVGTTGERTDTANQSTTTAGESAGLPEWSPTWTLSVPEEYVLGLDSAGDLLVATVSTEGGPSAVAAIDPSERDAVWRAEFEGEAVGGSDADYRPIARGGWGVTVTAERVFVVTGRVDSYDWTAVRAIDRASGEHQWSLRRERRLAVRGIASGTAFVTGLEFFEPEHSHDTPEGPLTSVLYAIDADAGSVRWRRDFAGVADVDVGPEGVYVAAGDDLVALGLDGTRRWSFGGDAPGRTVRVADGRIYYLTEVDHLRSTVHGLSRSGDAAWERRLPVDEVLLDGDRLYAGGVSTLAIELDGSLGWLDRGSHGQWLLLSPDGETLYTRAGRGMDRARAYRAADGTERWTYVPPDLSSRDAWPVAATDELAVVEGITAEHGDEPFTTLYAVRDGEGTKAISTEPVFDIEGLDGTVFVGGETVVALEP